MEYKISIFFNSIVYNVFYFQMSKQALLPSPNWFLNSLADCAPDGTLAYGSRNGIVLVQSINFTEGCAPSPSFSLIPNAHREKDRVTALAFSNRSLDEEGAPFLLASSGDDGAVAIWDFTSQDLIQKHSEHVR
jgi:WD40 repeat protein